MKKIISAIICLAVIGTLFLYRDKIFERETAFLEPTVSTEASISTLNSSATSGAVDTYGTLNHDTIIKISERFRNAVLNNDISYTSKEVSYVSFGVQDLNIECIEADGNNDKNAVAVRKIIEESIRYYPEIMFAQRIPCDNNQSYSIMFSSNKSTSYMVNIYVQVKSNVTAAQMKEKYKVLESGVKKIAKSVPSNLSDVEKVIYVHDYICTNFDYSEKSNDAYGFLVEKEGTCQSYAYLFCAVMRELGLDCTQVSNEGMAHMWNAIKIGNNWYCVDCTHDDPVISNSTPIAGNVTHNYVLLSTHNQEKRYSDKGSLPSNVALYKDNNGNYCIGPKENPTSLNVKYSVVHNFDTPTYCNSTDYESRIWNNVSSQICYCEGNWYFLSTEGNTVYINRFNSNFTSSSVCHTDNSGQWSSFLSGFGAWNKAWANLTVKGNSLYYNTADSIKSYNPSNNEANVVFKLNNSSSQNIYGITYKNDGNIYYSAGKTIVTQSGDTASLKGLDTKDYKYLILSGDLDGKAGTGADDLALLKKHLIGTSSLSNWGLADFNNDNRTDLLDLIRFKAFLAGSALVS